MNVRRVTSTLWTGADLLDLVAPRDCVACASPGRVLCRPCEGALASAVGWTDQKRVEVPVAVGGPFTGVLGEVVRSYKDGSRSLVSPLARVLLPALRYAAEQAERDRSSGDGSDDRVVSIVSIPASRRADWARGEDILTRVVTRAVGALRREGWRVRQRSLLTPGRVVADQRGLSAQQRRVNIVGSLQLDPREVQRWVGAGRSSIVVVDDVLTTGATLREAVRVLGQVMDKQIISGAVIAATTPRQGERPAAGEFPRRVDERP